MVCGWCFDKAAKLLCVEMVLVTYLETWSVFLPQKHSLFSRFVDITDTKSAIYTRAVLQNKAQCKMDPISQGLAIKKTRDVGGHG